jgi:hypothetical protein
MKGAKHKKLEEELLMSLGLLNALLISQGRSQRNLNRDGRCRPTYIGH